MPVRQAAVVGVVNTQYLPVGQLAVVKVKPSVLVEIVVVDGQLPDPTATAPVQTPAPEQVVLVGQVTAT